MASDFGSVMGDQHHDDAEWDAQKENFRQCYMDDNMTLKAAATYMADNFGFLATPRQWERKVKRWGFTKYLNKDERLQQIADTGRSVIDVSLPGRRSRGPSSGNLAVEDRNLRRFARRHLSRERTRSRSRSTSTNGQGRDPLPDDFNMAQMQSMPVIDKTYDLHFGDPHAFLTPNGTFASSVMVEAQIAAPESTEPIQLLAMQESHISAPSLYMTIEDSIDPLHIPHMNSSLVGEAFPDFSESFTDQVISPPQSQLEMLPPAGYRSDSPFVPPNITITQVGQASPNVPDVMFSQEDMNLFTTDFGINDISYNNDQPAMSQPDMPGSNNQFTNIYTPGNLFATQYNPFSNPMSTDPLWNDVLPLLSEYTRSVQEAVLRTTKMNGMLIDGQNIHAELARNLSGSEQMFAGALAVVLDNYSKTQQRAVQSMKDTCSKLRQKNILLESAVARTQGVQAQQSHEQQPHRQSLPTSYRMTGYGSSTRPPIV